MKLNIDSAIFFSILLLSSSVIAKKSKKKNSNPLKKIMKKKLTDEDLVRFVQNSDSSHGPTSVTGGIWAALTKQAAENPLEELVAEAMGLYAQYGPAPPQEVSDTILERLMGIGRSESGLLRTGSKKCGNSNCQVPIGLKDLWGYGCWCNFGANLSQGYGKPVDPYDSICKSMQQCMKCAVLDSKELDQTSTCDPKTTEFTANLSWNGKGLEANCQDKNDNPCSIALCMCEVGLVKDLLGMIYSAKKAYPDIYLHDNGFNRSDNCDRALISDQIYEESCCGNYPKRGPFNNAVTSCCKYDQNLFNPIGHTCCAAANGVVAHGDCT